MSGEHLERLTDRELLVLIAERTDVQGQRLERVEKDVAELKEWRVSQSSFFSGAKALWGILLSLPIGTLAWLIRR